LFGSYHPRQIGAQKYQAKNLELNQHRKQTRSIKSIGKNADQQRK